jgi:hypothetical protein
VGEDRVYLKNGGMLRGKIVALEPGEGVTIVVAGETKRYDWDEVRKVDPEGDEGESEVESPDAEARPKVDAGSEEVRQPPLDREGVIRLHIETDLPTVQLLRKVGSSDFRQGNTSVHLLVSEIVCRAPCDEVIDGRKGQEFYFDGKGMYATSTFQIFDLKGDVVAEVDTGNRVVYWTGVSLGILGVLGTSAGLGLAAGDDYDRVDIGGYVTPGSFALLTLGLWTAVGSMPTYDLRGADEPSPRKRRTFTDGKVTMGASINYGVDADSLPVNGYGLGVGVRGGKTFEGGLYFGTASQAFKGEEIVTNSIFGTAVASREWQIQAELGYDLGLGDALVARPILGAGLAGFIKEATCTTLLYGCNVHPSTFAVVASPGAELLLNLGGPVLTANARYNYTTEDSALLFGVGAGGVF